MLWDSLPIVRLNDRLGPQDPVSIDFEVVAREIDPRSSLMLFSTCSHFRNCRHLEILFFANDWLKITSAILDSHLHMHANV